MQYVFTFDITVFNIKYSFYDLSLRRQSINSRTYYDPSLITNQQLFFIECLKGNINYENTQISNLNERYTHGQTVKLSCATGYVGSLRLECENGIWTKIAGRECKSKHTWSTANIYESAGRFRILHAMMKTVWFLQKNHVVTQETHQMETSSLQKTQSLYLELQWNIHVGQGKRMFY